MGFGARGSERAPLNGWRAHGSACASATVYAARSPSAASMPPIMKAKQKPPDGRLELYQEMRIARERDSGLSPYRRRRHRGRPVRGRAGP